jgi:hypothetical protein
VSGPARAADRAPRFFNTAGPNDPKRHYTLPVLRHAGETLAIEIKVWHPGRPDPLVEGLGQLDGYLASLDSGWLAIFDRRADLPPVEERVAAIPRRPRAAMSP